MVVVPSRDPPFAHLSCLISLLVWRLFPPSRPEVETQKVEVGFFTIKYFELLRVEAPRS